MKRLEVERAAEELYREIVGEGWGDTVPSVKTFWRRIARWHLIPLAEAVKARKP